MIEDDSYSWAVSRYVYVHLNLVRAGIVERPEAWPWSSYPGYAEPSRCLPWVDYDRVLEAQRGEFGGDDPATSYRGSWRPAWSTRRPRRSATPSTVGRSARGDSWSG